jgi:hypothetical protein
MQIQPQLLCDLSLNGTGLNEEALLQLTVGQALRSEAQQSVVANLGAWTGMSNSNVQTLLQGAGELQRLLQHQAVSLLGRDSGVADIDAALLLQAIIESSGQ